MRCLVAACGTCGRELTTKATEVLPAEWRGSCSVYYSGAPAGPHLPPVGGSGRLLSLNPKPMSLKYLPDLKKKKNGQPGQCWRFVLEGRFYLLHAAVITGCTLCGARRGLLLCARGRGHGREHRQRGAGWSAAAGRRPGLWGGGGAAARARASRARVALLAPGKKGVRPPRAPRAGCRRVSLCWRSHLRRRLLVCTCSAPPRTRAQEYDAAYGGASSDGEAEGGAPAAAGEHGGAGGAHGHNNTYGQGGAAGWQGAALVDDDDEGEDGDTTAAQVRGAGHAAGRRRQRARARPSARAPRGPTARAARRGALCAVWSAPAAPPTHPSPSLRRGSMAVPRGTRCARS